MNTASCRLASWMPEFSQAQNWRLEAALTGTLEAYLRKTGTALHFAISIFCDFLNNVMSQQ